MEVHINVSNMCRICLIEDNLIDILLLGEPTSKWMVDIHRYFGVQIIDPLHGVLTHLDPFKYFCHKKNRFLCTCCLSRLRYLLTFHEDKSTKLCLNCYRKIEVWRKDVHNATKNQNVIEFLDAVVQKQVQEGRNRQNQ